MGLKSMKESEPASKTTQEKFWLSDFGEEYLKRNLTYDDFNNYTKKKQVST